MTEGREKERRQMIQAALEAKAPKMYQELKGAQQLSQFLTDREQMLMNAFRQERNWIMSPDQTQPKPGEDPIQQAGRINNNLMTAWNQTLAIYLDFGD